MSTNFEQDIQSTRDAFLAGSLTPVSQSTAAAFHDATDAAKAADALPQQLFTTLQGTFKDLADSQQSQLAEITPLAAKDPDTFKARMATLRQTTIDSVHAAINKAYDEIKNAGLRAPARQPALLEAAKQVAQLAQGFVDTASQAFDEVDHAGSLVIGGLSEGATEVQQAFEKAGDAIKEGVKTVTEGLGHLDPTSW
jgi:hypothetical protein